MSVFIYMTQTENLNVLSYSEYYILLHITLHHVYFLFPSTNKVVVLTVSCGLPHLPVFFVSFSVFLLSASLLPRHTPVLFTYLSQSCAHRLTPIPRSLCNSHQLFSTTDSFHSRHFPQLFPPFKYLPL